MTPQEFLKSKGISSLSLVKDPEGEYYSLVDLLSAYSDFIFRLAANKAKVKYDSDYMEY